MSGPTHRAYTVIKREGKEDYWLNLGVGCVIWSKAATDSGAIRPPILIEVGHPF